MACLEMGATGGIGIEMGTLEPLKGRSGLKGNCRTFEGLTVNRVTMGGLGCRGEGVRE